MHQSFPIDARLLPEVVYVPARTVTSGGVPPTSLGYGPLQALVPQSGLRRRPQKLLCVFGLGLTCLSTAAFHSARVAPPCAVTRFFGVAVILVISRRQAGKNH